ncbi:MAG TPA: Do family serine endopeptidase [Planctomycetaceae bacterium]|jgi:serine protease Do|nr:Do family serine endopeptidase [Planctomycetaceae bacterium]
MRFHIDRWPWLRSGIGGAGLLALAAAGLFMGVQRATPSSAATSGPPPAAVASANDLSTAFRYASEKVMPAVVTVHSTMHETRHVSGGGSLGLSPDQQNEMPPMFRRFFGDELPEHPEATPHSPRHEGTGSGVIIDASGIILTNNHVVKGAEKVTVRLHDGREFEASQVKTDPKTDIAVIRINGAGNLPAVALGDSDAVQVGDWVLAIGTPFGLQETVTAGIISAKSRGIGISEREDYLQTDAAINPGNSGGPLVNLRGEVVGINTAISTHSGGNEGVGFAVPINLARWISRQLVDTGSVQRAFLGVGIQPLTNDLSKHFGLSSEQGAVVTEVRPDTPAARAGLQTGDVIVQFDDHSIHTPRDLQSVVERAGVGVSHKVVVSRHGKSENLNVVLQAMPKSSSPESTDQPAMKSEFSALGLEVSELTGDAATRVGLKEAKGVLISAVSPQGPAEAAGLREGMVISRVGRSEVTNVDSFRAAVSKANLKDGLMLLVRTAEGSRFLVLKST